MKSELLIKIITSGSQCHTSVMKSRVHRALHTNYHYLGVERVPQWRGSLPRLNRPKTNWGSLWTPSRDTACSERGGEQLKSVYLVGFTEERVTGVKAAAVLLHFLASSFSLLPPQRTPIGFIDTAAGERRENNPQN